MWCDASMHQKHENRQYINLKVFIDETRSFKDHTHCRNPKNNSCNSYSYSYINNTNTKTNPNPNQPTNQPTKPQTTNNHHFYHLTTYTSPTPFPQTTKVTVSGWPSCGIVSKWIINPRSVVLWSLPLSRSRWVGYAVYNGYVYTTKMIVG